MDIRTIRSLVLVLSTATLAVLGGDVALAAASTPTGTSSGSPTTLVVTTLADSGSGSLRDVIQTADNGGTGTSFVVDFSVNGTITLSSDLPPISTDVTIDGTSAPTYTNGGPPVVELDCNGHAGVQFAVGADGSQLLGLAVVGAASSGVTLSASSITLNDDYIGIDLSGAALGNSGDGLSVAATSSDDRIGLNPTNASGIVGNVISGNAGDGVVLAGSAGTIVVANRIGTNPAGTAAIPNGGDGIALVAGAHDNEIGGTAFTDSATGKTNNPTGSKGTTTPVVVVPPLGNLVSGNHGNGIAITTAARHNVLNGNFVGTTAGGDGALGNGADGVLISDANNNSLIGCQFKNNPFVYYNILDANGQNGLQITNADHVVVQANFFGVGANNTTPLGNHLDGILVDGLSTNIQVGGVIPLGNVAAGNGANGIEVRGRVSSFTTFNTFGGLLAFKGAAPNGNDGLLITATGGNNLVRTNVFSGNDHDGIELAGNASRVTIDPNIVGLTTDGTVALPNADDGLLITGQAHDNTIGGSLHSVIPQNTFSGNTGYGVVISGRAHDNRLFGSDIGTNVLGRTALANRHGGVLVIGRATRNAIGIDGRSFNLISGNTGNGVTLSAETSANRVVNDIVGLNRRGEPLPNSAAAIVNRGTTNTVARNTVDKAPVRSTPRPAKHPQRGGALASATSAPRARRAVR